MTHEPTLAPILLAYGLSELSRVTPLEGGLINRSYRIDDRARRLVLQRLHPIFAPSVNLDIAEITAHLAAQGVPTPRLVPTRDGAPYVVDAEGACWRALTFLEGRTVLHVERPAQAESAARLVARFHCAVRGFQHTFHFTRPGAHDTALHLARLEAALDTHGAHPKRAEVLPVAAQILQLARALEPLPDGPKRLVHGDLKISNVLFAGDSDEALALLDLDTMAELTLPIELGDALRSWCNPAGEDEARATFRSDVFEATMAGFAPDVRGWLTMEEREALVLGALTISLELAARFCADALNESYFGWNPAKFPSRSAHNLARATSQLQVGKDVASKRAELEAIVRARFA